MKNMKLFVILVGIIWCIFVVIYLSLVMLFLLFNLMVMILIFFFNSFLVVVWVVWLFFVDFLFVKMIRILCVLGWVFFDLNSFFFFLSFMFKCDLLDLGVIVVRCCFKLFFLVKFWWNLRIVFVLLLNILIVYLIWMMLYWLIIVLMIEFIFLKFLLVFEEEIFRVKLRFIRGIYFIFD